MSKKFDPNKLEIVDFRIVKGRIDAPLEFDSSAIENYETQMSFDPSFDYESGLVRVEMGFEITTESDNDQKEANAEFDFAYLFEVENLKDLMELKKKKIENVDDNLIVALAAISFSTSRGILMTRLQGTAMEDYILKIIPPEDLLKEDTLYS